MTTAKSSFSIDRFWPVYRNMLRRHRAAGVFYGALCFLFLPMQYLLYLLNAGNRDLSDSMRGLIGIARCYNGFSAFFFPALALIAPLVLAASLYSYMQNKRSVDVYHSLPLTRAELYLTTAAAGVTLMWIPLLLNFTLVAVTAGIAVPGASVAMIFFEMLCWMAATFSIFAVTAFAAVQVGTVFDTAAFSLVLIGSLPAVYLVMVSLAETFLYGFSSNAWNNAAEIAYRLSPASTVVGRLLIDSTDLTRIRENDLAMLVWFVLCALLLLFGAGLYTRRKSEQAEQVGNFGPLQIYVRAIGTLLAGVAIGAIFMAVMNLDLDRMVVLACFAVGSLIAYFIGDVILTRTVRKFLRALPAALATTLACCILIGSVMYGGFGYENRVPDPAQVESVTFQNLTGRYEDEPFYQGRGQKGTFTFSDPASIMLVTEAHRTQVAGRTDGEEPRDRYSSRSIWGGDMDVTYQLRSGRTLTRSYWDCTPETKRMLLQLEATPAYIEQAHPIFRVTAADLRSVEAVNLLGTREQTLRLTAEQKSALIAAIQNDLRNQPAEEISGARGVGYLQLELFGEVIEAIRRGGPVTAESTAALSDHLIESELLLTESCTETLALLNTLGAADTLKNDLSEIGNASMSLLSYNYLNCALVHQTSYRDRYAIGDNKGAVDPASGEPNNDAVALAPEELSALWGKLTNVRVCDTPTAIVRVGGLGEETTGYFLVALDALPVQLQNQVLEAAVRYSGVWTLQTAGLDPETIARYEQK